MTLLVASSVPLALGAVSHTIVAGTPSKTTAGGTGSGPANGTAPVWSLLITSHAPPGLAAGGAMAWDPVDQYMVLFGGCGSGDYWFSTCTPTNQTWIFATNSNGTSDWSQLTPAVSPPARFYASLAWDDADGYLVLFGGNGSASTGFLNDTWTFVGGNWTHQTTPVAPAPRAGASLSYDAVTGTVVLFGGEQYRTLVNPASNTYVGADFYDTWSYSHGSWTQNAPTASPTARDAASTTYDPGTGSVVVFGGFNWTTYNQDDTWEYAAGNWSSVANGTSSPLVPGARNGGAFAYDPALGTDVLFGGHSGYSFFSDTWTLTGHNWSQASVTSAGPSGRWGASLAYDPPIGCLVLQGGYYPGIYYRDTWLYGTGCGGIIGNSSGGGNSTSSLWSQLNTSHAPPGLAAGGAMAWDPVDQYLVLFGGCSAGDFWFSTCTPTNQTWTFSTNATGVSDWTLLNTPVAPPARFYSSLAWDDADGYLVLFGGNGSATTGFLGDTWSFVHGSWTQLSPVNSPAARAGASLAFDARSGTVVLYGGEQYRTLVNPPTNSYVGADFSDTWSFARGNWTPLSPTAWPPARDAASVAYDAATGSVDLFGGFNWTTYNQNDGWSLSSGSWTTLAPFSASIPGPRNNGAMTFDPAIGADLLFGGHNGYQFYQDTWTLANGNWTMASNSGPSARWGASLAYDPTIGCPVLFGGYMTGMYDNDTWIYGATCGGMNGSGAPSGGTPGGHSPGGSSGGSGHYSPGGTAGGARLPATPSRAPILPGPVLRMPTGHIQIVRGLPVPGPSGSVLQGPAVPSLFALGLPFVAAVAIGLTERRKRSDPDD